jgi:hypothetical protein
MDPKTIEMNNIRLLNDYLNQTIDAVCRQPRFAQSSLGAIGFSPFTSVPGTASMGTDTVYGPWTGASFFPQSVGFGGVAGTTGMPFAGASFGAVDPFLAQRGLGWQQPSWSPLHEVSRQQHMTQALAAKQAMLESMCRACGIPV